MLFPLNCVIWWCLTLIPVCRGIQSGSSWQILELPSHQNPVGTPDNGGRDEGYSENWNWHGDDIQSKRNNILRSNFISEGWQEDVIGAKIGERGAKEGIRIHSYYLS